MVLLISTYDLGRQPFGLASAAAALKAAGHDVVCADLAKQKIDVHELSRADAIAFFLPMHTATRLAIPVIHRARTVNPSAHIVAYGLYAPLNAPLLRECGVTTIVGGEFEDALVRALDPSSSEDVPAADALSRLSHDAAEANRVAAVPRVTFRVPDRSGLLPLTRYATLQLGTERRVVGYTEASRGCKHRCRHCPVVPVYDGRFRIVPVDVVIADVAAQVAAGARHITFGDPDFFNGIKHAAAVLEAFARRFPGVSYDVTIKVEHLLAHADRLPMLRDTGCAFVTSAIESVDDRVLAALEKGHTRADFERIAARFREIDLGLAPTFVAFTPWTTIESCCDLLETIDRLDLVDQVAPIQLAIRLLVTEGSRLLELTDVRQLLQPFNPRSLTYPWVHPDARVDRLQKEIESLVGVTLSAPRRDVFARVWAIAHDAAGRQSRMRPQPPLRSRATVPYLNEPWYC